MLSIRSATANDIPLIRRLADETWWATYPRIVGEAQVRYMLDMMYSTDSLIKQMESGHIFLLAYDGEDAVGFASYSLITALTYKLHKLYVLPSQQRKGAGRALLDLVLAEIKNKGAAILELNVNRHNPAAGFYGRLGFSIVREEDIDIGGGYWMNDYVMRKTIDT